MKQWQNAESIPQYWRKHGYPLASETSFSMLAIKSILEEKPYPIKAAVVALQNIVAHIPDDEAVVKALEKLDFVVVLDSMWGETCKYADLILPVPFFFETTSATINAVSKSPVGQIAILMKAVDPPADVDARTIAQIIYELTKRLMPEIAGGGEKLLKPMEIWREQAKAMEIDFEKLVKHGTLVLYDSPDYSPLTSSGVLPTKTGEIELLNIQALKDFSEYVDKPHNLNPFPTWIEPFQEALEELADDEFIPVDYMHNLTAINTWARNTQLLIELVKWDENDKVLIHRARAEKLGIKDGDTVEIYNPKNGESLTVKVKLTEAIDPSVIAGVHGLTPGEHEGGEVKFTYMPKNGINTNFLASFQLVDGIACSALQAFKVKVRKVSG